LNLQRPLLSVVDKFLKNFVFAVVLISEDANYEDDFLGCQINHQIITNRYSVAVIACCSLGLFHLRLL
ncbi:hypothetical protein, partial [uncultured Parasutterella sp.]|uniref:hypothetical protein n=1 Tax=uncultured Parasutterella sp. TaxID=1263098 RepID=UPI0025B6C5A3